MSLHILHLFRCYCDCLLLRDNLTSSRGKISTRLESGLERAIVLPKAGDGNVSQQDDYNRSLFLMVNDQAESSSSRMASFHLNSIHMILWSWKWV